MIFVMIWNIKLCTVEKMECDFFLSWLEIYNLIKRIFKLNFFYIVGSFLCHRLWDVCNFMNKLKFADFRGLNF